MRLNAGAGRLTGRHLLGLILVFLGVLLLLNTTGLVDTGGVVRWFPLLLVVLGMWRLATGGWSSPAGPLLLIAVGVVLQLLVLDILTGNVIGTWWPLALVLLGAAWLLGGLGSRGSSESTGETVDVVAFLGGVQRRVSSSAFRGGHITAFLGGAEVELGDAQVAERPARLDVTAVMGSVEVLVPAAWVVQMDTMALLGGSEDTRRERIGTPSDAPHLVVTGLALFGGVEVKQSKLAPRE